MSCRYLAPLLEARDLPVSLVHFYVLLDSVQSLVPKIKLSEEPYVIVGWLSVKLITSTQSVCVPAPSAWLCP